MPTRHFSLPPAADLCIALILVLALLVLAACSQQPDSDQPDAVADQAGQLQEYVLHDLSDDYPNFIQTRFGLLEIERWGEKTDCFASLFLDGFPVFCTNDGYLVFHHHIQHNQRDLILFLTDPGGTAYQFSQFWFLVLEPGAEPLALTHKGFTGLKIDATVEPEGANLIVNLGFESGWRKTARLEGRELRVDFETAPDVPLSQERCQWLHREALAECAALKHRGYSCADPGYGLSGYIFRSLLYMAERPGFPWDQFISLCTAACETGYFPEYSSFTRQVCSRTDTPDE